MSNVLAAIIDEQRNLVISPSEGFAGENNAEIIEIDIGPFADEGYEYYILNFENFGAKGKIVSNIIRTSADEPSYIDNGVIICPLTSQLTAFGRLRIQLEAHKSGEKGEIVRKSSVAELSFKPSVMGEDDMMDSKNSVYGRLEEVENKLEELVSEDFGASIDNLRSRTSSLEDYADETEERLSTEETKSASADNGIASNTTRIENAEKRIGENEKDINGLLALEISETLDSHSERIEELENRPVGIGEIPLATDKEVGGFKLSSSNEFNFDSRGGLILNYSAFNPYYLMPVIVLGSLHDEDGVTVFSANSLEDYWPYAEQCIQDVIIGFQRGFAFLSFSKDKVQYYNENYELVEFVTTPRSIYTVKMVDGALRVTEYAAAEQKRLFLEGMWSE